jgi:TolB-like protein/DNA-binding winged helix-turn-helix (wHTH) protein/Tfp pilus assembly protein PilF
VRLERIPMDLLILLVCEKGRLVSREEIIERLWGKEVHFDTDNSINTAIRKIRRALDEDSEKPQYIETVQGKGYRFKIPLDGAISIDDKSPASNPYVSSTPNGIGHAVSACFVAPVEAQNPAAPESTEIRSGGPSPGAMPAEKVVSRSHGARAKIILASCLVVAIGLLTTLSQSRVRERLFGTHRPPRIESLAVLPLVNLSSDVGQDFFADGMTDELTTDLGKISELRVISRTSAMQYKGSKKPLREIARELNVDAVIEGTVTRSGSHLRVTANLVRASPENHLWAESYESEVGNALTVQGEIARAVAREIQVQLTQHEQHLLAAARPVNPEAQDLYLRGLYTMNSGRGSAESSEKAIKYFEQAIEKDRSYAAAYAALATVYAVWIPGMTRSPRNLMPKAREFALKALTLDNTLADAHSVLGMIALFYDWDWAAAEREYKQTMALNPSNVRAHEWHARGLVTQGRIEEAIAEAKQALALSPSPLDWDYPIWVFILARRYDLARERAREFLEVAPNYVWGHFEMAQIYERQGQLEEAAQESLKADELFGADPKKVAQLKEALAKSGPKGYWRRTLENYRESVKSNYVPPLLVAEACVRVDDKECAFEWLEKGFEERDDLMIDIKVEPLFDGLRSDPRFQDLERRVGIPP